MKFLSSVRSHLSKVLRSRHVDAEMEEEMRLHIRNRAEDLERSGLSREEAERSARVEFGGVERFKEEVRDVRWETHVEDIFKDFRYAGRGLWKDKRFAFVAVFALALGIGASTVVFSVFYNLMFNAFAAKDAGRLVIPVVEDAERPGEEGSLTLLPADLDALREQNRVFENIVGYVTAGGIVLANDGPETYQFFDTRVTADAFEFYGVPALLGRGILPDDGKPGAAAVFVMSYKAWNGTFHGDLGAIGRNLVVDGELRTLVGVMPPRFQAFGSQADIWIPINRANDGAQHLQDFPAELLGRLKPGVTLQAAAADLNVIVQRLSKARPDYFPKRFTVGAQTAADNLLTSAGYAPSILHSDLKHLLYDLLAAVTMLLLIACSNVANLLLSRATVREKEMAVRTALGASRGRLVRQLLAESSVLAMAACVAGCAFAWCGVKFVSAILPRAGDVYGGSRIGSETGIGLNPPVLLFALGLALLTTIVCGLAPALRLTRGDLQSQLAGSGRSGDSTFRHGKLRAALVIAEVGLSIVLLTGAGLMMRSLYLLTHVDMGFNPKNVLMTAFLPPPSHSRVLAGQRFASPKGEALLRDVVERMKALPGVTQVAVEDAMPGYSPGRGFQTALPDGTHSEEVGIWAADENLISTVELRLKRGRWLSEREVRTAQYVGVITQRLARDLFGDAEPVGQQIYMKGFKDPFTPPRDVEFQVVGVVADVRTLGPQQPAMPIIFVPYTVRGGFILLLKTTVDPASLRHAVQQQVWAVDRDEIIGLCSPLADFFQKFTYATPEFGLSIATPLASISLLLVIVGVFSVMAYTVSLRTQEIGVRMALGAQRGEILRMVLRTGFALLASGIFVGLFASYGLTRFLKSQIWGVSTTDPWTFGAVVALVVITGLAACLLPARRAASVDPLVALRYE
jgi:putative ABC transport system permease protein